MHLHDTVLKGIQLGSGKGQEGYDLRMTFVQCCIDIIAEHVSMLCAEKHCANNIMHHRRHHQHDVVGEDVQVFL